MSVGGVAIRRAAAGGAARASRAAIIAGSASLWLACSGCASGGGPVFAPSTSARVWPPPPDAPRVRYVGELLGEESLNARRTGLEALREALAGPRPQVRFVRPVAVALLGERVFVADTGLAAVHLLDLDARTHALLVGSPADPLQAPLDVVAVGDEVVVVDRLRAALDRFDRQGRWLSTTRIAGVAAPVSAAWSRETDTLWVLDAASHSAFPTRGASAVGPAIGGRGSEPGRFNHPAGIAASEDGALWVADAMNFRVQSLGARGDVRTAFGAKGDAAGDFALPRDVAVDSAGRVFVLDNQFENVQVFDASGQLLMALGGGGQGAGEFSVPVGITVDDRDRLWIADSLNRRVQVLEILKENGP